MAEIRFKQSDVVAVVGLSESSIIRYRKKKVFTPTFEQSKHGKTYMIDSVGVKQIVNEYNIGRTVDPVDYNEAMCKLYIRAGLEPPLEYTGGYSVNTNRIQYENTMNAQRPLYENEVNSQWSPSENAVNTQRQPIEHSENSHGVSNEHSSNTHHEQPIIEGEYYVQGSEYSHNIPNKQPIYDINNPPPVDEFITVVVEKLVNDAKRQLREEMKREMQAQTQLLLEATNRERTQYEKEIKDAQDETFKYKAFVKHEAEYKKASLLDRLRGKVKKPDPKDYGIEIEA